MAESNPNFVHLVVQHTQSAGQSLFRIIAYRPDIRFQPAEFASLDELLTALGHLAGFDERRMVLREREYQGTYIAFIGDFDLDESQLLQLGLRTV